MVYRVYAEKKPGFDHEAAALYSELKSFLGISGLTGVRILNRYDVENLDAALFEKAKEAAATAVFLLSPRSSGIVAQKIIVDAGMEINYFDKKLVSDE